MAKSRERFEVRRLRREKGMSIKAIAREIGVSKSSVSFWCRDIILTDDQKRALIESDKRGGAVGRAIAAESKIKERLDRMRNCMNKGLKVIGKISNRDLLVMGAALYWAEGNKKNRRLLFSNSDPVMIKMLIRWLTQCLHIQKSDIYCRVGINQLHRYRIADVERYWSGVTGVSLSDFRMASLKKVRASKVYENPENHFGTLNIMVKRCTNLSYLVLGMIEGLGRSEAKSW